MKQKATTMPTTTPTPAPEEQEPFAPIAASPSSSSSSSSRRHYGSSLLIAACALMFTFLIISQGQWSAQLPNRIGVGSVASVRKKDSKGTLGSNAQIFLNELEAINASLAVTSNVTSAVPPPPTSLSPRCTRDMIGYWIGNTWIPPQPWRYYSPAELRELYKHKTILWLGDSLARRSFASFYNILNSTRSNHTSLDSITLASIIDFNKHGQVEYCPKWRHLKSFRPDACRPMPGMNATGEFIKMKTVCFSHVEKFLHDELNGTSNLTSTVDLVVLVLGIWDVVHEGDCRDKNNNANSSRTPIERLMDLIHVAANFTITTGKRIVWRTSGFDCVTTNNQLVYALNDRIMDSIDHYHDPHHEHDSDVAGGGNETETQEVIQQAPNLTYINWGGAVEDRSFGKERIFGDHPSHYGPEPRVVLVQMLTNHLHDLGWFA
jgi:hypothetical protein